MVMDGHDAWLAECAKIGYTPAARHYQEGTRTSQDAANQLGCEVAHIAKSIVFAGKDGAVVVITSGANRVDRKKKLKRLLGYKPSMTDPNTSLIIPDMSPVEFLPLVMSNPVLC